MKVEYTFDAGRGVMSVDDQPVVFHCNHYNRVLQYTIQNSTYVRSAEILTRSAAEVAYLALRRHFEAHPAMDRRDRLDYAADLFRAGGYGILNLREVPENIGSDEIDVVVPSSHYGEALCLNFEPPLEPSEYFDLGYAIGAFSAIFERPFDGEITEQAISMGRPQTLLHLRSGAGVDAALFDLHPAQPDGKEAPGASAEAPSKTFADHIDERLIVSELAKAPLLGDPETGLIPAFGVNLTRMFADYYNLISFRFEQQLSKRMADLPDLADLLVYDYPTLYHFRQYFKLEGLELIRAMLIEAGHVCGFNTMGGIMTSDVWKGLVLPMIRERDDWIQGIVSCINALGWGVWRIAELIPDERLVLRAWHPYESLGYLRWFGRAGHGVDYCMAGVASSIMNLMYEGDIVSYPELTSDYYQRVNCSPTSFWVDQTRCVASGDPYSEIVVTRRARH